MFGTHRCLQMRRWEAELAALRDASSSQDQQWLTRNTKRCPACTAPIEASSRHQTLDLPFGVYTFGP